jgi:hypothetical protein
MCKLLKDIHYWWDEACEGSFQWIKTTLTTLLVFIVPDWTKEFHVHIDALNYVIRTMLVQNPDDTIDKLIYYANRLTIGAEKNYSTTEKEVLAMIYVIKKICH